MMMIVTVFRYIMEKVDLVIVGAEGVVESGGIINKVSFMSVMNAHSWATPVTNKILDMYICSIRQIGTYQMAVCSKAHNKPFYVVAESFKFVRLYPLNQQDVPDRFKVSSLKCASPVHLLHRFNSYLFSQSCGSSTTHKIRPSICSY